MRKAPAAASRADRQTRRHLRLRAQARQAILPSSATPAPADRQRRTADHGPNGPRTTDQKPIRPRNRKIQQVLFGSQWCPTELNLIGSSVKLREKARNAPQRTTPRLTSARPARRPRPRLARRRAGPVATSCASDPRVPRYSVTRALTGHRTTLIIAGPSGSAPTSVILVPVHTSQRPRP